MDIQEVADKILHVMDQNGIIFEEKVDIMKEDVDLRDFVDESIQFIAFIMDLEEEFGVSLSDEFLIFDNFGSLRALSTNLKGILG